jgi:putative transposase
MYYERNLPHWQPDGKDLFVTWRLKGSLPVEVIERLRITAGASAGKRFREFDDRLDSADCGPLWLRDPRIAAVVTEAFREAEKREWIVLQAFVVMPNHVHVLLSPRVELRNVTKWIKGSTSRKANEILGISGQLFWQDESFDHWIRGPAQFDRVKEYIERNPVVAGLVKDAAEWPWSSARR